MTNFGKTMIENLNSGCKPEEGELSIGCSVRTEPVRLVRLLFTLNFENEESNEIDISITSHSQFFRNLLAVLNHQPYPLATGEMIPVVVKATRVRKQGSESGSSGEE
jgi:hypothetical protein